MSPQQSLRFLRNRFFCVLFFTFQISCLNQMSIQKRTRTTIVQAVNLYRVLLSASTSTRCALLNMLRREITFMVWEVSSILHQRAPCRLFLKLGRHEFCVIVEFRISSPNIYSNVLYCQKTAVSVLSSMCLHCNVSTSPLLRVEDTC